MQQTNVLISGLPSSGYPIEQVQPSPQPAYPGQNVYPSGYPQNPNVPYYEGQQQSAYPQFVGSGYPVPPPSFGPYTNYPATDVSSSYPGYIDFNQVQGHIYPDDSQFTSLYPAAGNPYSYSVNTNNYPEKKLSSPAKENKVIKPQVTSTTPVSTEASSYFSRPTQSPTEDTNEQSVIDVRVNYPEPNEGQKAVILGKNELFSGSFGYPSSLNPQYVNSPTKAPTKTSHQPGQESNLVVLSSSKPESSTPVYSVSTKSFLQPGSNNYDEPSSTPSFEDQFSTHSQESTTPVNIISYPLPIVPNPGSCPCYFVPPTSNSTDQPQQQQPTFDLNNIPEGAVVGFVPVVFYPSCGGASKELLSSKLEPIFPSAYQVPYKCSYCEQSESQTASIKHSFDQVVKQSQLNPSVVVKSPSTKINSNSPVLDQPEFGKRIKYASRKSEDEQN